MSSEDIVRLRSIKTFKQLIDYLKDDLGWPIAADATEEEIEFDWTPEELGLDATSAVDIKEIKQLRPLAEGQPWGIFFISFEKKRLPIVILRRILNKLVIKKRASANKAQRAAWQQHDLLFISSYGEEKERALTFAHFSEPRQTQASDVPTLRVLGWDGDDTNLKYDYVVHTLKNKLAWPKEERNLDAWRKRWAEAFVLRPRQVIQTSQELATRLAELARSIRHRANIILKHESEHGKLRQLHKAFQEALIHDLKADDFADMYAQTVAYGLFALAVRHTSIDDEAAVTKDALHQGLYSTSPFLKEMLETFLAVGGRKGKIDFDELGIQEVVDLLNSSDTHMEAVLREFGNRDKREDPVIYFYEDFLKAYDNEKRVQRGVFYTPQPVVSYIVRSVHELLQAKFGLSDGLADTATWGEVAKKCTGLKVPDGAKPSDPFVVILDPATGTATFLVEVIEVIHSTLVAKWKKQGMSTAQQRTAWNDYVPKHLLSRLHGYELMMAPYAIAHMKIGLKLYETGYRFRGEGRAHIYLTNALEPTQDFSDRLAFDAPALAHEADAVGKIKRHQRFTVVVGNPPYANYSANLSPEARRIVDKYRAYKGIPIRERNQLQFERNLQDDFVKFLAIAESYVQAANVGVLGYITNGTMLASNSLRGMREHLLNEFDNLHELNLHGGVNEIVVGGEADENVFDIAQSVAIHLYVRSANHSQHTMCYADLFGERPAKYEALLSQSVGTMKWQSIQPDAENCSFIPQDDTGGGPVERLDSVIVQYGAGIKTNRDAVAIGFDCDDILNAVHEFNPKLRHDKRSREHLHPILYRPFDIRRIFYHEEVIASRSLPTMQHILAGPNIGIISSSTWTTPDRFSVNISRIMVEMKTGTHDRGTTFFPLYRYESLLGGKAEQVHNLAREFVSAWSEATKTRFISAGAGDLEQTSGPEDVLHWLYGLFHSPEYRRRHRTALAQGFPIVLLSSSKPLLRALSSLGAELSALHLMDSPKLNRHSTEFVGSQRVEVSKISWSNKTVWIDKAQSAGFKGVTEDVWNFHVGGYPVCEKWLKDRKGRTLSKNDIEHYHRIVVALHETIRIMAEIDKVIDKHGGWPIK